MPAVSGEHASGQRRDHPAWTESSRRPFSRRSAKNRTSICRSPVHLLHAMFRSWASSSVSEHEAKHLESAPDVHIDSRSARELLGNGAMRLLGVFYPAGSPALRYAADAR
jgi:hypothetical protein